jgi:glutaconate CoA-transferase subunit A
VIYDRMIAAGCASKIVFSWAGNPGVGSLQSFRRAVVESVPNAVDIEEYTHFGLVSRLVAGAQNLPFLPVKTFTGSDLPAHNGKIRTVENPYEQGADEIHTVPPLRPDVAVVRAQRADANGNGQIWGILGDIVEAAFAANTTILSVEEVVDEAVIRSDPNRTVIPESVVDYVVEEPFGSHPSYAQGYYRRDNQAYIEWADISNSHESTTEWLEEWVYGVANHQEYLAKMNADRVFKLLPNTDYATPINMGRYS